MIEAPRSARSLRRAGRPARAPRTALSRVVGGALSLAGGAVVLFHAALLAERLRDLSIAEPAVLASWLGAAVLGALALYLRRRGLPIASGRSGLVFWLLVLLLHLGLTPTAPAMVRAQQLLALPLELASAGFAAALAVAFLVRLCAPLVARRPASFRREIDRRQPLPSLALGSLAALFVPRPPPVR